MSQTYTSVSVHHEVLAFNQPSNFVDIGCLRNALVFTPCVDFAGIGYLLNATAFNQSKVNGYKSALGTIANVPPCWISIMDVTAYNLNPNGSLGSPSGSRRLLQTLDQTPDQGFSGTAPALGLSGTALRHRQLLQSNVGAALGINAFLPSTNSDDVLNRLNTSYGDGALANGISPNPLLLQLLSITPEGVRTTFLS